jgi:hypothetical protein
MQAANSHLGRTLQSISGRTRRPRGIWGQDGLRWRGRGELRNRWHSSRKNRENNQQRRQYSLTGTGHFILWWKLILIFLQRKEIGTPHVKIGMYVPKTVSSDDFDFRETNSLFARQNSLFRRNNSLFC